MKLQSINNIYIKKFYLIIYCKKSKNMIKLKPLSIQNCILKDYFKKLFLKTLNQEVMHNNQLNEKNNNGGKQNVRTNLL